MAGSGLICIIPCHDEAATLGAVVRGAARHGDVLVVDDRSSDGSREVAERSGARVIAATVTGYDGALETGLRLAVAEGYDCIVTIDADGEHDPDRVGAFAQAMRAGASLVCGVRARPQRAAEHLAGWIGGAAFGMHDPLCGMKGYRPVVLRRHIENGRPLALNMGPAMAWIRAKGDFIEVEVTGTERRDAPRFGRSLRANAVILSTFLGLLTAPKGPPL